MTPSPKATRSASGRRAIARRAAGVFLVAVFALAGAGLLGIALTTEEPAPPAHPPQPDPAAAPPFLQTPPATASPSPDSGSPAPATAGPTESPDADSPDADSPDAEAAGDFVAAGLERSEPTGITIPRIGVDAEIITVGLDEDDQIEVPPLEQGHLAGWYQYGPTPGEVGNSVIVGHVDSFELGPAVFFELGALKPGDTVEVEREDGTVAEFVVDGVASYPKQEFPTELVYGPVDQAQLRVITCGGAFDESTREYVDNIIVFATLADPA